MANSKVDVGKATSWEDWPNPQGRENDDRWKKNMCAMYGAITELKLWDTVRTEGPPEGEGYMFWESEWLDSIYRHPLVDSCGFSGFVQAHVMQHMKFIADNGWEKFVEEVSKPRK